AHVPRAGACGREDRAGSASVRALLHPRDRRAAAARGVPDLAPAARRADALYARTLGRHLPLDGEVEHDRARRHLREHGGQPRLAINRDSPYFLEARMKKVKASMMNAIHDLPLLVARD